MSKILPQGAVDRVAWFEAHTADWQTNAVAIGTTTTAVTALTTRVTAARAAFDAQQLAFEQAKAATQNFKDAVAAMTVAGAEIIKQVKAKAASGGNAVYTLALLPVPATPAPVPPPGTPTDFSATLNPDGSLKLRWKCANPANASGTIYQVSRKVGSGGAGSFSIIGGCGTRTFDDPTVPAGVASVTYQVQAVRSTAAGVAAQFVVNFGVGGSGEAFASVVGAAGTPKLAA
jgi:hypothetical protein